MFLLVITISNFILRRGFALSQTVTQPHCVIKQESPANAKVSARQQCVYEGPQRRNLQQINATNTMMKSTCSAVLQRCR